MPTPQELISIYLIDDEAIVRAGLRALLSNEPTVNIVGDSGDARQAIGQVAELRPDLILLDIAMEGMSGLDAVQPLKRASPNSRVLMASQHEGRQFVFQALRSGADGYISKSSDPRELAIAIESIHRGESFVTPRVSNSLVDAFRASPADGITDAPSVLPELTRREREVFQLIAVGNANKEIALQLQISLGTVKKHRENVQRKLDCHSAAEIARVAIREGLIKA